MQDTRVLSTYPIADLSCTTMGHCFSQQVRVSTEEHEQIHIPGIQLGNVNNSINSKVFLTSIDMVYTLNVGIPIGLSSFRTSCT